MELELRSHSSRNNLKIFDPNEPFSKNVDEMEEYSFYICLNFYEGEFPVAEVRCVVFDEDKILDDGADIVDIADMFDGDTEYAISMLINSDIYKQELDDNLVFVSPYSCYIDNLYVNPEYRNKGIAKYIFNNLYEMFLHCFNINTRCFVICPSPQTKEIKESYIEWSNVDDETMRNLMINVIEKYGYKELDDSGFYAINCMANEE